MSCNGLIMNCGDCKLPEPCKRAKKKLGGINSNSEPCMYYTLCYLLENAMGQKNIKSIDEILEYLKQNGCNKNRETWQSTILQELKKEMIAVTNIYSGGGVFIP